ncbi:YqaA family protein [Actinobacillus lignieresii]|uniref:SNARE associated Golgi protein n=1 Tax=Actinobacillus lignieresii TaxID=720 RepID=A0A380U4E6_ACTLI|nr:YqaA family protein [Actinobacillus lignieresii]SUT96222.1 SNARE associated Golgi protein [Actinobacillus lignieresii]VEB27526.1 SNARE associated Golgi protein [Actinobacillus lignieresii]
MKLFGPIYDKTMEWSKHRFAGFWLSFVSFIEAIFFPIPPDVMLIPMSMGKPQKAMRYAIYTTIASVLGGIIGYFIGLYAFEWVQGLIADWGMQANFDKARSWFETWGVAVVFLAGFSPIPYKVFTICAGVMQMAFFPFVITAAISRFARFALVAKLSAWGGEKYAEKIRRSIELIGWGTIVAAALAYIAYQLFK